MVGNNIAALRKMRGLNQVDLANAIHVTQSAVSQWETGRTVPDLQQLYILSDFFGVSVDTLTSEKGIIPTGTLKASREQKKIDTHTYYAERFGPETQRIVDDLLARLQALPEDMREDAARGALTFVRGLESETQGKT